MCMNEWICVHVCVCVAGDAGGVPQADATASTTRASGNEIGLPVRQTSTHGLRMVCGLWLLVQCILFFSFFFGRGERWTPLLFSVLPHHFLSCGGVGVCVTGAPLVLSMHSCRTCSSLCPCQRQSGGGGPTVAAGWRSERSWSDTIVPLKSSVRRCCVRTFFLFFFERVCVWGRVERGAGMFLQLSPPTMLAPGCFFLSLFFLGPGH